MWDQNVETRPFKDWLDDMKCSIELDRSYHSDGLSRRKVMLQRCEKMGGIDRYIHKNIERLDLGNVHGYQAAVGVVNKQIAA